ncbi:MAG: quinolinate synthase NadA [Proteobacteria bacterium]|nr:quinolinate synthase NadA [Desulfobacterales bacterium]MBL6968491.1 quinolinate synthase NadA [Desulfobacteraceae bacterium]MBU1904207.1 quinolinate synthase NadA [Pseudomonadota bacterium]
MTKEFTTAQDKEARIRNIKRRLGKKLLILTHHYQRKEIVDLGDYRGDSFGLSQKAARDRKAQHIVFCGVHFMAESAAILAQPHQSVQIPDLEAGCWMANMAHMESVEKAWDEITSLSGEGSLVPIVYMNSDAALKAFCGRHGGAVCTSSNAPSAFQWGFAQREKVFFFPDQHLGRNTANRLSISPDLTVVWDPEKPLGDNTPEAVKRAKLILWNGFCLVHTRFQEEDILNMRKRFPGAKIVVHPECTQEVVALADAVGSTSFIVKFVREAPPGSTVIVGTEINLINRLALENPDKKIFELHYSLCPNMFKIDLDALLSTLEEIGRRNLVTVPDGIKADARLAMDRMLSLTP